MRFEYFTLGHIANYREAIALANANNERVYKDVGGYIFRTLEDAIQELTALNMQNIWGVFVLISENPFDEIAQVDEIDKSVWVLTTPLPIVGEIENGGGA